MARRPHAPAQSLHSLTVEAMARWIVGGRFVSGSLLPNEADLGEELRVSRTVVREAVRTLVAKGMLETRRRHGTQVQPKERWSLVDREVLYWQLKFDASPGFLDDLYEFRMGLETFVAARCAAEPTFDKTGLLEAMARLEAAVESGSDSWADADLAFHRCLLNGTKNHFFAHIEPLLDNLFQTILTPALIDREQLRQALPDHRAVAEAVAAGNPAAAREAMEVLIAEGRRNLDKQLCNFRRQNDNPLGEGNGMASADMSDRP